MYILGIDTSCDDCSVAVARDDCLESNVSWSQVEYHAFWGGVVPSIAKRKHRESIDAVVKLALSRAGLAMNEIDVVAVTTGPGLAVALEVGVEHAKLIARQFDKPVVAVNHMEGHIYANFAKNKNGKFYSGFDRLNEHQLEFKLFPIIALLISGGHTEMILMSEHLSYQVLGRTKDDAIGEAYDKVARMLNLGYPGGPIIERLAREGNREAFALPVSMLDGGLAFSYSGLKTAVMRHVQLLGSEAPSMLEQFGDKVIGDGEYDGYKPALSNKPVYELSKAQIVDMAASFEYVAVKQLEYKLRKAIEKYPYVKNVLLGGGVVGNQYLRSRLRATLNQKEVRLIYPRTLKLTMDNAGMIAVAGFFKAKSGAYVEIDQLDRNPTWELGGKF